MNLSNYRQLLIVPVFLLTQEERVVVGWISSMPASSCNIVSGGI